MQQTTDEDKRWVRVNVAPEIRQELAVRRAKRGPSATYSDVLADLLDD